MSRPKIEVASYKGRRRPLWLQILLGLILAGALAFAVLLGAADRSVCCWGWCSPGHTLRSAAIPR